jgi:hypothetical protein
VLSQILSVIEGFERTHGCPPAAVCLNTRHMLELMDEWADLFDGQPLALGVRLVVVAESEAPLPQALGAPARPRAPEPDADVLLAWTPGQQSFA